MTMIVPARDGPNQVGIMFELVITAYASVKAIVRATPLNAYAIYLKPLVSIILEKGARRTTLSNVSTGIMPIPKNAARMRPTCTPSVADALAPSVHADI